MTAELAGTDVRWQVLEGDALAHLCSLPSGSVDAIVSDPPYGIAFKGEAWDGTDITKAAGTAVPPGEAFERFTRAWASECLRLLKPGGHLTAFGAPRMVHRLVAGIEDAGFEIRDQLLWVYGSGMPKGPKLPGGRGTALKPGYEPILLARRPAESSVRSTLERHGTGALNIEATRVPEAGSGTTTWRWPANLALSHHDDCTPIECGPQCPRARIDRAHPERSPSRLFYCPKPSVAEREAGCEQLPEREHQVFHKGGSRLRRNVHPTVKPLGLMRWLIRLITPPGGLVLDPFTGSGSTGAATVLEQRRFVGIERDHRYIGIARARIGHWEQQARIGPTSLAA